MSDTEVAEVMEIGRSSPTPLGGRHEKSLGLLTAKFVDLLQVAENGVLDLKKAADMLDVKQKRRIYDITNVLEGIGLIEKETKNTIKWKGASQSGNSSDVVAQLEQLKCRLVELEEEEKRLEEQYVRMKQCLRNLSEDTADNQLAYVTHSDVNQLSPFKDATVMAIQAPVGTQLHAEQRNGKFKMHMRSPSGPINVLVLNGTHQQQQCHPVVHASSSPSPTSSSMVSGICQLSELCSNASPPVAALPGHHTSTACTNNSSHGPHSTVGENNNKEDQLSCGNQDKPLTLEEFIRSILDASGDGAATPMEVGREKKSHQELCMSALTSELLKDSHVHDGVVGDSELREEGLEKVFGSMMGMAANEEPFSYLHDMENRSDHEGECVQLFKLSPVAGEKDYFYHLDEREGLTDLYDLHS